MQKIWNGSDITISEKDKALLVGAERKMIKNAKHLLPITLILLGILLGSSTGLNAQSEETTGEQVKISQESELLNNALKATSDPVYAEIDHALGLIPRALLAAQRQKRYQDKIQLLLNAAKLAERKGDILEAKRFWKSALSIVSDKKSDAQSGQIYMDYAAFLRFHAEPQSAIDQLLHASAIFRASRESLLEISAKQKISLIYAEEGMENSALGNAESAISSAISIDDLHSIGNSHLSKGIVQMILGQSHQQDLGHFVLNTIQLIHSDFENETELNGFNRSALESLETAIDFLEKSGDRRSQANCLRLKGNVMLFSHKLEDAKKYYQEAYQLFSATGNDSNFVRLQASMAAMKTMDQDLDTGTRLINAAINANEIATDLPWLMLLKSEIALKDFNDPLAKTTLEEGLLIATENNDFDQLIALNQLLSLVEINLGNYRQGFTALDAATQFQVQQANAEKDQVLRERKQDLEELEKRISSRVKGRTQALEDQLFTFTAFAKNGWLMGLTFVVCFIGLMMLRQRNLKETERELYETKTKLLEAEETIAHAKADRNSVFRNLAQELRTPMNGIVGSVPLLMDGDLTSFQENCVNIVDVSSRSITTLINDISDLSQLESGNLKLVEQSFSMPHVVESVVQLFEADADHSDVEVVCDIPSDPIATLYGDPNRIQQILITLISRALQSTYDGLVYVRLEALVPNSERKQTIRITVEDTGNKPNPDELKDFFDLQPTPSGPNSILRPSSMIGLSITQKLVNAMRGTIVVEESNYGGTLIQVVIPFTLEPGESEWKTQDNFERFPRKRALIVDSSQTSAKVLSKHLRAWALNFEHVEDVNSASQLLESPHGFDVIFLDSSNSKSDLNLLEKIAAIRSHSAVEETPIILLSKFSDLHSNVELKRKKFIHNISKPFSIEQLHASLRQALLFKTPVSKSYAKLTPEIQLKDSSQPEPNGTFSKGFHFIPYLLPLRKDIEINPDLRILLAEDNLVNQKVTALMLKKMGFEIDIVTNGRQAVTAVAEGQYDVVLMDKIMPVMDGLESTREIRKLEDVEQPIIVALTASATMEDEIACRKASMDNFLAKPVPFEKMKAALGFATNVLAERRTVTNDPSEQPS